MPRAAGGQASSANPPDRLQSVAGSETSPLIRIMACRGALAAALLANQSSQAADPTGTPASYYAASWRHRGQLSAGTRGAAINYAMVSPAAGI